jgi:hypothetical protein
MTQENSCWIHQERNNCEFHHTSEGIYSVIQYLSDTFSILMGL